MIKGVIIFLSLTMTAAAQVYDAEIIGRIDYFSSENILKFADHLFEAGDFRRAAGEYQRYLTAVAYEPSSDSIYYKSIRSLFLAGDYKSCRDFLGSYKRIYPGSRRIEEIDFYQAIILNKEGRYSESNGLLSKSASRNFPLNSLVKAANHLNLREFEAAREEACIIDESFIKADRQTSAVLSDLCQKLKAADFKYKSPSLAAALAILPGAGRAYCGKTGDALNSLFMIGLFGYLSYDGFHDDGKSSVRGWLFGTIGGVFYSGNIYGSAAAARIYNRKTEDDFVRGIDIDIALP